MTWAAEDLIDQMLDTAAQLRTELDSLSALAVERVRREHAYKTAWNSAFLSAEGSVPARKARADLETATLRNDYEKAAADEMLSKERTHSWRSILSALQTAANANREESRLVRTGPDY